MTDHKLFGSRNWIQFRAVSLTLTSWNEHAQRISVKRSSDLRQGVGGRICPVTFYTPWPFYTPIASAGFPQDHTQVSECKLARKAGTWVSIAAGRITGLGVRLIVLNPLHHSPYRETAWEPLEKTALWRSNRCQQKGKPRPCTLVSVFF